MSVFDQPLDGSFKLNAILSGVSVILAETAVFSLIPHRKRVCLHRGRVSNPEFILNYNDQAFLWYVQGSESFGFSGSILPSFIIRWKGGLSQSFLPSGLAILGTSFGQGYLSGYVKYFPDRF